VVPHRGSEDWLEGLADQEEIASGGAFFFVQKVPILDDVGGNLVEDLRREVKQLTPSGELL
jgi:hypothetical protein